MILPSSLRLELAGVERVLVDEGSRACVAPFHFLQHLSYTLLHALSNPQAYPLGAPSTLA
jgi:hypothetical protein